MDGNGDKGDTITVDVYATDGEADSGTASDDVTVVNSAPVVGTVAISPTDPKTNQTLTATPAGFTDDDAADRPTTTSGTTTPLRLGDDSDTLDLSVDGNGDKGDTITVDVYATDGEADSGTASDDVTVVNSAPVVGTVAISPTDPKTNQTLIGDAGRLHRRRRRRRAHLPLPAGTNGTTEVGDDSDTLDLSVDGNGDKGDTITVDVYATDG